MLKNSISKRPDRTQRTLGEQVNSWVQAIGIIIAGFWVGYTFLYKEVYLPRTVPITVAMDVKLRKIETSNGQTKDGTRALIPVEMRVTATNPSSREVYLLRSVWIAKGTRIATLDQALEQNKVFSDKLAVALEKGHGGFANKFATASDVSAVAAGSLFWDTSLKPAETTTRTIVFYVGAGYDKLSADAVVPTTTTKDAFVVRWEFVDNNLRSTGYHRRPGDDRERIATNRDGTYSDPKPDLNFSASMAEISLW